MRFLAAIFATALVVTTFNAPVLAANWQPVASVGGERVEIDKARIMRIAAGKTVAWTRLVLGRELTDAGGSYTAVQAMNRYDCASHKFATLKRVYMGGPNHDLALREETVGSPREIAAGEGSVDEKLLAEACKLRTVGEAQKVADEAARLAAEAQGAKPGVMHADMRTAGETPTTHTMPVVDAGKPELKADVEARPNSAAETKIEIRAPSERPHFIGLPKLDKPQGESSQAPTKGPEPKVAESKVPAKGMEKPAEKMTPPSVAGRHELERLYATSGPRRAPVVVRRQPAEEPSHAVAQHQDSHWSYEGEGSPANWGKLRGDFTTCATGRRQSPIDIRDGIRVDLEPIQFDYKRSQFRIVDNGHTVQVNVGEGSTMSVMSRTYQLLQFHFHRPSEERVNGKAFDMVVHLVHKDDAGKIAVAAVLLEKGAENPLIQTLWNNMPLEVDQEVSPAIAIDLNGLLPDNRAYYTYMGSLTTPPCTEDVLWIVFKQPMPVSAEQVGIFSRLYKNNARPIQPANSRLIKENR
jgi:carbonic anhydrase